jgi:MscS family membrane protein
MDWESLAQIRILDREVWRFAIIFGIVLAAVIGRIILTVVLHAKMRHLAKKTETELDDRLIEAVIPPLANFIYIIGLYFIVQVAAIEGKALKYAGLVIKVLVGFNLAYFAFRFVNVIEYYLLKLAERTDNALDNQFVGTLRKTLKFVIVIIAAIVIADNLGYNISGIIAGLGIGGLAVALAAQDSLANIFGSLTVVLDKPFQVGERIKVLGHDGKVEKIGLRSIRLRTLDGHLVTIPNKELTNTAVENVALRPTIKFITTIGVVYSTQAAKLRKGVQIIKDILGEAEHVEKEFHVYFNKFNAYSLDIYVVYWVTPAKYWHSLSVTEKINFAVKEAFEREGIEMAFPTQTVEVKKT